MVKDIYICVANEICIANETLIFYCFKVKQYLHERVSLQRTKMQFLNNGSTPQEKIWHKKIFLLSLK